jgi:hypothetical protein
MNPILAPLCRRRFSMKLLLALPIIVGLAIFVVDFLIARYFTAPRWITTVQFMAVDADTGRRVANAWLLVTYEGRKRLSLPMGKFSNMWGSGFGISRRLDSRMRGTGWTDYGGWSMEVSADGYQTYRASLADLTRDDSRFQNTDYVIFIARLQPEVESKKDGPYGGGGDR